MILLRFKYPVALDGYHWLKDPSDRRRHFLTENVPPSGAPAAPRRYVSLQSNPGLFRTFASVPPDRVHIKKFADKFGRLGKPELIPVSVGKADGPDLHSSTGEREEIWERQILDMLEVVQLWDCCQQRDESRLTECIVWQKGEQGWSVFYRPLPRDQILAASRSEKVVKIASPDQHPDLLARLPNGDVYLPAFAYIQREVNAHLSEKVLPRLVSNQENSLPTFGLVPETLLDALWLQCAEAISANKSFRPCQWCYEWFEITPPVVRNTRLFCSNACRNKVYRQRQERARMLHEEGKNVREIAREIETDVETVKRWIRLRKE